MGFLFAQSGGTASNPSYAGFWAVIIFIICYTNRKKAIGGWLLYYFIQLYFGFLIDVVLSFAALSNLNPAGWENIKLYILYILTTVPPSLFLLGQVALSFWLIPRRRRNWRAVLALRGILVLGLIFSLIAVIIDSFYWPESRFFSIIGLIWPIIWLPYFSRSKRVRAVYYTKNWEAVPKHEPVLAQDAVPQAPPIIPKPGDQGMVEILSDRELARTRLSIGRVLVNKGEYEEAEKEYLGAIRLEPTLNEAHYGLAQCFACRNMKREALDSLRQAIENGFNDWPGMEREKNLKNLDDDPWYKMLAEVVRNRRGV